MSTRTTTYSRAAGSIVSTLGDLRRYAPALATGRGLLDASFQAQRLTFVPTNDAYGLQYGLGIFQVGSFLGHDGDLPGYSAAALAFPRPP